MTKDSVKQDDDGKERQNDSSTSKSPLQGCVIARPKGKASGIDILDRPTGVVCGNATVPNAEVITIREVNEDDEIVDVQYIQTQFGLGKYDVIGGERVLVTNSPVLTDADTTGLELDRVDQAPGNTGCDSPKEINLDVKSLISKLEEISSGECQSPGQEKQRDVAVNAIPSKETAWRSNRREEEEEEGLILPETEWPSLTKPEKMDSNKTEIKPVTQLIQHQPHGSQHETQKEQLELEQTKQRSEQKGMSISKPEPSYDLDEESPCQRRNQRMSFVSQLSHVSRKLEEYEKRQEFDHSYGQKHKRGVRERKAFPTGHNLHSQDNPWWTSKEHDRNLPSPLNVGKEGQHYKQSLQSSRVEHKGFLRGMQILDRERIHNSPSLNNPDRERQKKTRQKQNQIQAPRSSQNSRREQRQIVHKNKREGKILKQNQQSPTRPNEHEHFEQNRHDPPNEERELQKAKPRFQSPDNSGRDNQASKDECPKPQQERHENTVASNNNPPQDVRERLQQQLEEKQKEVQIQQRIQRQTKSRADMPRRGSSDKLQKLQTPNQRPGSQQGRQSQTHLPANRYQEPQTHLPANRCQEPQTHLPANRCQEPQTHLPANRCQEPQTHLPANRCQEPQTHLPANRCQEPRPYDSSGGGNLGFSQRNSDGGYPNRKDKDNVGLDDESYRQQKDSWQATQSRPSQDPRSSTRPPLRFTMDTGTQSPNNQQACILPQAAFSRQQFKYTHGKSSQETDHDSPMYSTSMNDEPPFRGKPQRISDEEIHGGGPSYFFKDIGNESRNWQETSAELAINPDKKTPNGTHFGSSYDRSVYLNTDTSFSNEDTQSSVSPFGNPNFPFFSGVTSAISPYHTPNYTPETRQSILQSNEEKNGEYYDQNNDTSLGNACSPANFWSFPTCTNCHGNFEWPHLLSCFHTFCFKCLTSLCDNAKNEIKCPVCSWSTAVGKRGPFDLNMDSNLCAQISHAINPFPCGACPYQRNGFVYCVECMQFFCDACRLNHTTTASTARHQLEDAKTPKWIHGKLTEMCSIHHNIAGDLFCLECDDVICFLCVQHGRDHQRHTVIKDADDAKRRIQTITVDVDRMRDSLRKQLQPIILKKQEIESKARACKRNIHVYSNRISDLASKMRNEARVVLDHVHDDITKEIKKLEEFTLEYANDYKSLSRVTDKYLKDPIPQALLPVAPTIMGRFNDLQRKYLRIDELKGYLEVDLTFSPEFPVVSDAIAQSYHIETVETLSEFFNRDTGMSSTLRQNLKEMSKRYSDINSRIKDEFADRENGRAASIKPMANAMEEFNEELDFNFSRKATDSIFTYGERGNGEYAFGEPSGVAFLSDGSLVVCDTANHRIIVYDKNCKYVRTIGQPPTGPNPQEDNAKRVAGSLYFPYKLAQCPKSKNIVVIERPPSRAIQIFQVDGRFIRRFGNDVLQHPRGVAVDENGIVLVVEGKTMRMMLFAQTGSIMQTFYLVVHLEFPNDIAAKNGSIYISDNRGHCVHIFDYNGQSRGTIGNESVTYYPIGVSIDYLDHVVVTDNHNTFNISVFDRDGVYQYGYKSRVKHANCYNVAVHPSRCQLAVTSRDCLVILFNYSPFSEEKKELSE